MTELKYSKYIVTDPKPIPPEIKVKFEAEGKSRKSTVESTHLLSVDSSIIEDFFYVDCHWLWRGAAEDTIEEPHTHDFDEILSFFGSDPDNPKDLCGEVELWLGDEKHILTESFLVFIPAGMKHCPLKINRIDRPMFHLGASPSHDYERKDSK